ncbi:MAG: hypothetical protein JNL11_01160 [Bdellovibrionaceae bacterium]|nr:hypothetical protein [Pseudobdellovibrionaceae bacterium]
MKALFLVLILSVSVFAKVEDFNALISEDTQAQKELHSKLKTQVYSKNELEARKNIARTKNNENRETVVLYDETQTEFAAPSSDKFFRFKKEVKQKRTNARKNQHRVAKELKELGL